MDEVVNGPGSLSKCVTIGKIDRSFVLFYMNFPSETVFGFLAYFIAEITFSCILDSFAFTAFANLALVPTKFATSRSLLSLMFSNKIAFVPSTLAVKAAISYFVDTFFFIT